ncbi:MAG: hypothetical protein ACLUE2_13765 [Bacteroides cellulosilyticus]
MARHYVDNEILNRLFVSLSAFSKGIASAGVLWLRNSFLLSVTSDLFMMVCIRIFFTYHLPFGTPPQEEENWKWFVVTIFYLKVVLMLIDH